MSSVALADKEISIHAPRGGCDEKGYISKIDKNIFQSTHPAGGATQYAPFFILA